ncbi:MAG: metallophosphoesterase [Bacteroidales bacterium]|nr:metallophosphoesterase [Bacteroidales bacterium]
MNKIALFCILAFCLTAKSFSQSSDKWTFISHPDWHTGDGELRDQGPRDLTNQHKILGDMASFNPEFLLLTGDMVGGNWLSDEFWQKYAPGGSLEDLVRTCGEICYNGINRRFREFGFDRLIGCLGDHELGDQNWDPDSRKSNAVKYFKEAFSRAYTLDSAGNSLYDGFIGQISQRPVGTPYEHTSNAFIHKNVMVVTIDIYTFESSSERLDSVRGTVSIDITGEHCRWLDEVLTAGNQIDSVDFIIVQCHHPVLLPIRKHQTSHMTVLNEENSNLWKLLRKHNVDLYYAGEVHALTPSVDQESGIIQIVHGSFLGSPTHNYLVAEVEKGRLTLLSREKVIENEYQYKTTGKLVIDKRSGKREVSGSGALEPVDRKGLLIHYSFDDYLPGQRIGNTGAFGPNLYYGTGEGVGAVDGVIGQALEFTANSFTKSFGLNPFHADMARTFSCWVKTESQNKMDLITTGNGSFVFGLEGGTPLVLANGIRISASGKGLQIADNRWHHLAVSFPGEGHTLRDISFFVDGKEYPHDFTGSQSMNTDPGGFIILGAANNLQSDRFSGSMDDVGLWSSQLTGTMLEAIYNAGNSKNGLHLNASELDTLFRLFREKGGEVVVQGSKWHYEYGMKGKPGIIKNKKGISTLILNSSGEGVSGQEFNMQL